MNKTDSKSSFNDIEWETIRNKKCKPNEKKSDNLELNENYVPIFLRNGLDEIIQSDDSAQSKIYKLNKKINEFIKYKKSPDIDWKKRLNIYVVHKCCKQNRHEIIASILDESKDDTMYVNSISSTKSGNTCLFDAAYYGSDMCVNLLINRGADIRHINKNNETIYDILNTGMNDSMKRFPNANKIIQSRYEECIRFIKMAEIDYGKVKEVKSVPKEENIFKEHYDNETLKNDLIEYIEKPTVFKKFVTYLKENNFEVLLNKVCEDEDIEELFLDNPYAVKLIF
jgi:hypothetical protein